MITQKRKLLLSNIEKIGSIITMTEALEMMATYQHQTPDGIGAVLYRRELFDKFLNVPGCAGIRLVNAMHEGHHSIVLVAVDNRNVNITTVIAGKGSISPYYNPWESNYIVDKTGDFISKDVATDMIKAYQDLNPGTIKSNLYGREAFETLLSAPGCAGIRLFNGIAKDGDHKFVLVPVDAAQNAIGKCQLTTSAGMLFVDPPIIDGGMPCPPVCSPFDVIL